MTDEGRRLGDQQHQRHHHHHHSSSSRKLRYGRCNHIAAPMGSELATVDVVLALSTPKHDSHRRLLTFNYVNVLERSRRRRFDFGSGAGTILPW